ncbi:hypothetical protein [Primorskyibacter sp. 2E233]|uniref:hypothetical protein n=1 Tax=Primorskyibacter sp. 2E233 TaxID=3413431 RepID=UPI003BEFAA91
MIDNPNFSRPIDVHRWSDHPEVKGLVERVWERAELQAVVGVKGPKPRTAFKKQLRVLILDLYVAWLEDPELCIGVSMSPNSWKVNSRYNALHLSKKLIQIINALHDAGLLDKAKGFFVNVGSPDNRTARIQASEELQDWFHEAKFGRDDITRALGEELIVLRNDEKKQVEYKDTEATHAMRGELQVYNALLAGSLIDMATLAHAHQ